MKEEREFWERVYLQCLENGNLIELCRLNADEALAEWKSRWDTSTVSDGLPLSDACATCAGCIDMNLGRVPVTPSGLSHKCTNLTCRCACHNAALIGSHP